MLNITSAVKTAKNIITANSPVLLVGSAIAGVVATGVLAAKGGYKARGIVDEAELEKGEPLTVQEKAQLTWMCYAVPALTGASTVASVVGVHAIHNKRHAGLAGLYAVTTSKLDHYTEEAEQLLGPKKTQELNDAVGQRRIDENIDGNHEVIMTGNGNELCFDDWSGRYFEGSIAMVERAINEVNRMLIEDGEAGLNDFYEHVGLPSITAANGQGWTATKINARFGSVVAPDGRPAICIWFHENPKELGRR